MTKKVVVKLQVPDEKEKQKAMKAVSSLSGIESLSMDMKEKKLTVVGDVDPVRVLKKLKKSWHAEILAFKSRKSWHAEILTVGPAKKDEKKDEKKDDKKDEEKKKKEQMEQLINMYKNHNPYYTPYGHVYSVEENPNSCVIC